MGNGEEFDPVVSALHSARSHRSGAMAADSRFMTGQFTGRYSELDFFAAEHLIAVDLYIQMRLQGNMAARTSKGLVKGITDIVYEDFCLREKSTRRNLLSPVRVTAHSQSLVFTRMMEPPDPIPRIYLQTPADKAIITDERLNRWDLYQPGKPHANDAVRHMILFLRRLKEKNAGAKIRQ